MQVDWLGIFYEALAGAGGAFVVAGLSKWVGDAAIERLKGRLCQQVGKHEIRFIERARALKAPTEKEQKRVEAVLDQTTFVTRTQFETESLKSRPALVPQ